MANTASFKPVERGGQRGAPPSLEFVALDRLQVDAAYQRATDGPYSRRIIVGMVREWNWALCQPLVVSRRSDGSLWVLDGQHRHAGARERGDIAHLPCVVLPSLTQNEEAGAFVDLNTRRQRLSQIDIFNWQLARGDGSAFETAEIIGTTGWRVVRSSGTDGWSPGDLACAPMLASALRREGAGPVRAALDTLRRAYPDRVVTAPARILDALIALFGRRGHMSPADAQALVLPLSQKPPGHWLAAAATIRVEMNLSVRDALIEAIRRVCGRRATTADPAAAPRPAAPVSRPAARPAPAAGKQIVRAATSPQPAFGTSGKGWCDQCEQIVSRDRASACRSQFCKLKDAA